MVLFRNLFLSLPFVNLPLEGGLVFHTHHYFWANIRDSEAHGEVQISSERLLKRWAQEEGLLGVAELEESGTWGSSRRHGGHAWASREVCTRAYP